MITTEDDIIREYRRPGSAIAFSAPERVAKHFRNVSVSAARKALQKIDSYVLHKEPRRPRVFNPYFIYRRRDLVQADLIDVQKIKQNNDNISYLFLLIDIFTRKIWVYPLKRKTGSEVAAVLQNWLDGLRKKPKAFSTDAGREFYNADVQRVLRAHGINQQLAYHTSKAAYAERANKTLQILIYKYLTDRETLRYINVLDELVTTYNTRTHRSLDNMTPNEADLAANELRVRGIHQRRYAKVKRKKPTLKLHNVVRVKSEEQKIGKRAYGEQYEGEYFKIIRINKRLPIPLYYLQSMDTEENIEGGFYANELSPVQGDVFKIEKILARRRRGRIREIKVRWKYFGPRWDQWIKESDLV